MKMADALLNAAFPDGIYCIGCGALIDRSRPYSLCDRCLTEFHFATGRTCAKCGRILEDGYAHDLCRDCREHRHVFERGYVCMLYGLYEKVTVRAFKYHDRAYYGKPLGELMYDRIAPLLAGEEAADVIVPVPLHRRKLAARGYNQAELLAREVAKRSGIPLRRLLVRTEDTRPMSRLSPAERRGNLQNAFRVPPAMRRETVGKSILLIDDVYTSGSTADACTKELRDAGAKRVIMLSLAAGANAVDARDRR